MQNQGMDANDHVQQATPKGTNRLSSPEDEYNWSRLNTLENKKSEVHIEGKTGKDHEGTFEETPPNKQKQEVTHGELESFGEDCLENNSNGVLIENNVDNTNDKKDEDYQPLDKNKDETYKEMTQIEKLEKQNESKKQKNQDDSMVKLSSTKSHVMIASRIILILF
ncbi:hypothetical protein HAX54_030461 [Datura stramonium]|uniref:Uncharacterized protein n=1 Tax=Datura stramonium TaxID=4076 RepID=A0ABS8V7R4_DATST|nr:hypothetical protein [Datura stramonium]